MIKQILVTIVVFCMAIRFGTSQELLPSRIDNVLDSTYTKLELPPLQVFLNAVYNNASVKIRKEITEEEKQALQSEKKNWLNYFSIRGTYQYGVTSGNISQSDVYTPLSYTYTGTNQHLYNIGVNMNIPLDDLFNRKTKVNEKKSKVKQAEFAYEQAVEERKLKILQAYNSVLEHLTLLKVKSEAVALYNAQMKISENDFVKGKITVIDLSLERARRTDAVVNFQETKAALHNSITLLEMLTGVKIIK